MKRKALSLVLAAGMVVSMLAGCGKAPVASTSTSTPASTPASTSVDQPVDETPVEVSAFSEAPVLAAKVAAGTLPKVEDRLPAKDDVFVSTKDAAGTKLSIGTYGGNLNLVGGGGNWDISRPVLESIVRYNTDGTYVPNVIKSFEFNEDYTVWTFHLREGMKWSDGDDFNADDITFWYYMVHTNNFDGKASWIACIDYKETVGEETVTHYADLKKVDDYTVTFTFTKSKFPGDFIEQGDFKWCWAPSHYLKDLIPASYYVENPYWANTNLSDEDVLKNAKDKGIEKSSVKDLGKALCYYWWNIAGLPSLNSFVLNNGTKDDTLVILERNAYYWKVDAEGNQLPYVDNLYLNKFENEGQDQLSFISGDIDVIGVAMENISQVLTDRSDAVLKTYAATDWGSAQVTFNYTTTDANFANLFANIKFREAMSICVDRKQVSELLSDGFLEPGQSAPAEGTFGYDEAWMTKWTSYDVNAAKKLFEECGLVMGSDGFYDFADGTDLVLTFYGYTDSGIDSVYPVVEQYYNAAGIKCAVKTFSVEAYDQEIDNNNWIASINPHTPIGALSLKSRPAPFVPIQQAAEWYGEYGTYYQTKGASGVAPTGDMAKLVELYEQWTSTADEAVRSEIAQKIYDVHQENMWSIAYLKAANSYVAIGGNVKNWPDFLVWDDLYQYANIAHYENLYKAE